MLISIYVLLVLYTIIIYLSRVLFLCVCVTIAERSGFSLCFSNQTYQGDETEAVTLLNYISSGILWRIFPKLEFSRGFLFI